MTIAFGIGQTLGPSWSRDHGRVGSLSFALNVSAAMLALGASCRRFRISFPDSPWQRGP